MTVGTILLLLQIIGLDSILMHPTIILSRKNKNFSIGFLQIINRMLNGAKLMIRIILNGCLKNSGQYTFEIQSIDRDLNYSKAKSYLILQS